MKWIARYIVFLLICVTGVTQGQVLQSMDKGIPSVALASAELNNGYTVVSSDKDGYFLLYTWDGTTWSTGSSATNLFTFDNSGGKECRVLSVSGIQGDVFVLVGRKNSASDPMKFHVLKYASNNWSEITDQTLSDAIEINEILAFNGTLVAIGKNSKNTPANIFYFESGNWVAKGNYLTLDATKDYIIDAAVYGGKIYATGVFTKIGSSDKRYLAEWNGEQWSFVNFPPFTQQTYRFGQFNNQLVLYGKPATGNEAFRVFNGSNWQDLSSGLDKINIQSITGFAWNKQMLWASGSFENLSGTETSSLIYYHPDRGWMLGVPDFNAFRIFLGQFRDKSIINGDFETMFGRDFQHVAEISAFHAQLTGRFFDDLNANCLFESGEQPQRNVNFVLKPGDHYFTSDADGNFSIPVLPGNYSITPIPDKNREFKCNAVLVNVTGFHTVPNIMAGLKTIASRSDAAVRLYDYSGWKVSTSIPNQYRLCAQNVGTVTINSGKLIFYLPQELELFSFNPIPDFLDLTRAEWNLSNIFVNGEYCVDIIATLKPGADPTKPVKLNSKVELSGGQDLDPGDNIELMEQDQVSTIQQNAKSTSLVGSYNAEAEPLHYRISFQNQMNGTVNRIRITDTLDEDICIGAKGIIENTSHSSALTYEYHLLPDGRYQYVLNWDFNHINLPDSAADFNKSQGFIDLKIYTDMRFMKQGSEICNRAFLYFSNNEPLITNAVCNEIGEPIHVADLSKHLKIYPNPARQWLHIDKMEHEVRYTLYNLLGETVGAGQLAQGNNKLDVSHLAPGVYWLKVDGFSSERLMIQPAR